VALWRVSWLLGAALQRDPVFIISGSPPNPRGSGKSVARRAGQSRRYRSKPGSAGQPSLRCGSDAVLMTPRRTSRVVRPDQSRVLRRASELAVILLADHFLRPLRPQRCARESVRCCRAMSPRSLVAGRYEAVGLMVTRRRVLRRCSRAANCPTSRGIPPIGGTCGVLLRGAT